MIPKILVKFGENEKLIRAIQGLLFRGYKVQKSIHQSRASFNSQDSHKLFRSFLIATSYPLSCDKLELSR